jgi:hypothetical protein
MYAVLVSHYDNAEIGYILFLMSTAAPQSTNAFTAASTLPFMEGSVTDLMITVGHRTFSGQMGCMSCHSLVYPDTFSVQSLQHSIAQFRRYCLTSILFTTLGCTAVAVTV